MSINEIKGAPKKHTHHQMELRKGSGPHPYQLWCTVCNKHVQWISAIDALKITGKYCYATNC